MQKLALHGFLGLPSDWSYWPDITPCKIELAPNLWTWAENFNAWALENSAPPRVLIGYSMGGRLALHALLSKPSLWSQGILISTHPGLKEEDARKKRIQSDRIWAERFRHDLWEDLMQDWENQPIFHASTYKPKREEKFYSREELALQLENFSLGKQEDLIPALKALEVPLMWVTGEKDLLYGSLAKEALNGHSSHLTIPNASHRVHFECPKVFLESRVQIL